MTRRYTLSVLRAEGSVGRWRWLDPEEIRELGWHQMQPGHRSCTCDECEFIEPATRIAHVEGSMLFAFCDQHQPGPYMPQYTPKEK